MSTNPPHADLPAEDIDLLALVERLVLFLRKNKWTFLIAILLGLAFGFATWLKLPKVYKSRLVLQSTTLSNLNYIQVVNNWNQLLKGGEHDTLAATWNIPRSIIGKVSQMKGAEIQKIFTPNNPNGFYIDVFVKDNAVLGELQRGILTGFDNVEFIKRQLASRKDNLNKLIEDVSKEIAKLDSTKSKIESLLSNRNGQPSSLIVDISGLNRQQIDLNEKLLGYQHDLRFATAVQVIQGFSTFTDPAGPNLYVWLGIGFFSALALAFVFTTVRSVWKKVNARLQQNEAN